MHIRFKQTNVYVQCKLLPDYKDFVMTIIKTDKTPLLAIKTAWKFKPCHSTAL